MRKPKVRRTPRSTPFQLKAIEPLEERRMLTAVCSSGRDDFNFGLTECTSGASEGYTFVAPNFTPDAYLVDIHGRIVHEWTGGPHNGRRGGYLGPDGTMVTSGVTFAGTEIDGLGVTGALWKQDWDGNVIWDWTYSTNDMRLHHDLEILENGNVLAFAWIRVDAATMVANGRDPNEVPEDGVWSERIIEVQPTGLNTADIVWEWTVLDHVVQDFDATKPNFGVVADNPQLIDINFEAAQGTDWLHANAIDYNPTLNQIAFSPHRFDEIWILDHSTTTAEAAGHTGGDAGKGGDLLYRWGNPEAYDRGTTADKQIDGQHDVQWIPDGLPGAGNLLIFNNRGAPTAQLVEIETPLNANGTYDLVGNNAYGPTVPVFAFETGVASPVMSGLQRLPNGNTVATYALPGRIEEFDPNGNLVWSFRNADNGNSLGTQGDTEAGNGVLFKSERFDPSYSAFVGRDLTPKGYIEQWTVGDFDLSGTLDASDIDALSQGLSTGDMLYDVNFDNVLDGADIATLVDQAGLMLGDANFDGAVNNVDFGIWQNNLFTQSNLYSSADFNGDGFVDVSDYNIWNSNKAIVFAAAAGSGEVSLASWQNSVDPHDVNGDGTVSPLDALIAINELNAPSAIDSEGNLLAEHTETDAFLDINGDGFLSPLDALGIINRLNSLTIDSAFESMDDEDDEDE